MNPLAELIESANDLAALLEKKARAYVYQTANEKRWMLGSGGRSGNCEWCVDASDMGWVPDEDVYPGPMGDEDGPPGHPHCSCELEYRERRYRVYA